MLMFTRGAMTPDKLNNDVSLEQVRCGAYWRHRLRYDNAYDVSVVSQCTVPTEIIE